MLIRIFNGRNTILQIIVIIVYFAMIFLMPVELVENKGFNPLYNGLYNLLVGNAILIKISFIILVAIPILLTQFFSVSFGLFKRKHYHFLFIAPLLIFSFPNAWSISPVLVSLALIIFGVQQLFNISNKDRANEELAFSAITFSIASLIYTVLLWDILLLIFALFLFRQFNMREVFLVISSFLIPYIYLFSWFFIKGNLAQKWDEFAQLFYGNNLQIDLHQSWFQITFIILVIIFSISISISIFKNIRTKLIQIRDFTTFLFLGMVFSTILLLFAGNMTSYHYIYILFSIAILASILFSDLKLNWFYESFILLFLIHNFVIMYQIIYA